MSYGFRLCFTLPTHIALDIDSDAWPIDEAAGRPCVVLRSRIAGQAVRDSRALVLAGQGYDAWQAARDAGQHYRDMLMLTSAYLRLGFSFGPCPPQENPAAWPALAADSQGGRPLHDDSRGLQVYDTNIEPAFTSRPEEPVWLKSSERFERVLQRMLQEKPHMTERGRLAYDLFSSSFAQKTPETRFLLLMQAMLILQVSHLRSAVSVAHIDLLIEKTSRCPELTASEQTTMAIALEHMKNESVIQGGCRLVEHLGSREYGNLPARTFWLHCAALKGRLTLDSAKPVSREEFEVTNPSLENMVGDLLCGLQSIREIPAAAGAAAKAKKTQSRRSAVPQPVPDPG
jgi:hypothetical protein